MRNWTLLFSFLAFSLTGCTPGPNGSTLIPIIKITATERLLTTASPVPSNTPVILPPSTVSPKSSATQKLSPTKTNTPPVQIKDLQPGVYLYGVSEYDFNTEISTVALFAKNGDRQDLFSLNIGVGAISPNNRFLAYNLGGRIDSFQMFTRDISNSASVPVPAFPPNLECTDPNWSPDSMHIVATCWSNNSSRENLFVFSLEDQSSTMITSGCSQTRYNCNSGNWSPKGEMIAFNQDLDGAGPCDECGIYVIPTSCLSDPTTCMAQAKGTRDAMRPLTWAPDGERIAARWNNLIRIYAVSTSGFLFEKEFLMDDMIYSLAWSPNGETIAAVTMHHVYLVNVANEEINLFKPYFGLMGWITIP